MDDFLEDYHQSSKSFGVRIRPPLAQLRFDRDSQETYGQAWNAVIFRGESDDGGSGHVEALEPDKLSSPRDHTPAPAPVTVGNGLVVGDSISRGDGLEGNIETQLLTLTKTHAVETVRTALAGVDRDSLDLKTLAQVIRRAGEKTGLFPTPRAIQGFGAAAHEELRNVGPQSHTSLIAVADSEEALEHLQASSFPGLVLLKDLIEVGGQVSASDARSVLRPLLGLGMNDPLSVLTIFDPRSHSYLRGENVMSIEVFRALINKEVDRFLRTEEPTLGTIQEFMDLAAFADDFA